MILLVKFYFYFFLYFFIICSYRLLEYYVHFIYNYLLVMHISLVIISYVLFFILFINQLRNFIHRNLYLEINSFFSLMGIYYSTLTIFIGTLWAFSIWKSLLFFDSRIFFILLLILYFIINIFLSYLSFYYRFLFFFFLITNLFLLRIKNNWSSQIHQTNSFFFFIYNLPIVDSYYASIFFSVIILYTLYLLYLVNIFSLFKTIQLKNILDYVYNK